MTEAKREEIFLSRLDEFVLCAELAMKNGCCLEEVVVVMIEVDSRWRDLVDQLMPAGFAWDALRSEGPPAVLVPLERASFVSCLSRAAPSLAKELSAAPSKNVLTCVLLADSGTSYFEVLLVKCPLSRQARTLH